MEPGTKAGAALLLRVEQINDEDARMLASGLETLAGVLGTLRGFGFYTTPDCTGEPYLLPFGPFGASGPNLFGTAATLYDR
jgi:hypothetical protein